MATAAELAGVECPDNTDSISIVPEITGDGENQREHKYLYWEFYELGGKQAVRAGHWKAIRMPWGSGKTELYDLSKDLGETNNVADANPDVVKSLEAMMDEAHVDHPNWEVRGRPAARKQ